MTDKTAIEKAKEAEACMDDAISCILRGIPVLDLDERMVALDSALAALEAEKPAESASKRRKGTTVGRIKALAINAILRSGIRCAIETVRLTLRSENWLWVPYTSGHEYQEQDDGTLKCRYCKKVSR
jgi:uncharacterized small protein (DUF1192 family)